MGFKPLKNGWKLFLFMKNNRKGEVLVTSLLMAGLLAGVILVGVSMKNAFDKKLIETKEELELTSEKLGAFRPSNYVGKLTTRLVEGGSELTFNTNPGEAADGTTLTTTKLGDFIVITINPGGANEEKISVSGVSTTGSTTATWTIINRGLSFTENVSVSGNIKQHSIGEKVIISNDDHYLNQQYIDLDSSQNITGLKTFNTVLPTTSLTSTTSSQFTTKGYVDALINQGAATSTESNGGIVELATRTEAASTTASTSDKPLVLQAQHSTSTPGANITAAGGSGETYVVMSEDDGKLNQGWIDLTETFNFQSNLGVGTSTPIKPLSVNGDAWVTGTTTASAFVNASSSMSINGVSYNYPSSQGSATSTLINDGSGNLSWVKQNYWAVGSTTIKGVTYTGTFSHTLGRIPRIARVNTTSWVNNNAGNADQLSQSRGIATSTVASEQVYAGFTMGHDGGGGTWSGERAFSGTGYVAGLQNDTGTVKFSFYISAWTSSTLTIVIDANSGDASFDDTRSFFIELE